MTVGVYTRDELKARRLELIQGIRFTVDDLRYVAEHGIRPQWMAILEELDRIDYLLGAR